MVNIVKWEFNFSPASLPTLGVRALIEIILTYIALKATALADRSTFGFVRVVTMPLLLIVDFLLGYKISNWQLAGIGIIIFSLFLIFLLHGIKRQGVWLSLLTAVMAVATISLYKYNITHYNSVAAEQTIIYLVLLAFLIGMAFLKAKENPFAFLKQKIYFFQTLINAIPSFANSYAYAFAPASVILSAYRSSAVFWSVVSGKVYFKEKHLLIKLLCLALLISGIILLAI
jgi:drug/metabolite transporter (DMT)-like permease